MGIQPDPRECGAGRGPRRTKGGSQSILSPWGTMAPTPSTTWPYSIIDASEKESNCNTHASYPIDLANLSARKSLLPYSQPSLWSHHLTSHTRACLLTNEMIHYTRIQSTFPEPGTSFHSYPKGRKINRTRHIMGERAGRSFLSAVVPIVQMPSS